MILILMYNFVESLLDDMKSHHESFVEFGQRCILLRFDDDLEDDEHQDICVHHTLS